MFSHFLIWVCLFAGVPFAGLEDVKGTPPASLILVRLQISNTEGSSNASLSANFIRKDICAQIIHKLELELRRRIGESHTAWLPDMGPKRKRPAAETEEPDRNVTPVRGDSWMLSVEGILHYTTPFRRNAVLSYMAQVFLVRRYVSIHRGNTPSANRYLRLPAPLRALVVQRFPGEFVYARGASLKAPQDTSVGHLLRTLKINDEPYDFCSQKADSVLATASPEQAVMKAYVMARTYSRDALTSAAFQESWTSIHHGLRLLLDDLKSRHLQPRDMFTTSFGPNCRDHNSCAGTIPEQRAWIFSNFPDDVSPLLWRVPSSTGGRDRHASKEELFMQIMEWPRVGCLTGKNIYQLLRRCESFQQYKAAARNAREASDNYFAFSSAGSRMATNLLFAEPAGRGFCRDVATAAALRHFSPLVLFLQKAFMREMRKLAGECPLLNSLLRTFESQDENFFVFILCEVWKLLCFLATADSRYEHAFHSDSA